MGGTYCTNTLLLSELKQTSSDGMDMSQTLKLKYVFSLFMPAADMRLMRLKLCWAEENPENVLGPQASSVLTCSKSDSSFKLDKFVCSV